MFYNNSRFGCFEFVRVERVDRVERGAIRFCNVDWHADFERVGARWNPFGPLQDDRGTVSA